MTLLYRRTMVAAGATLASALAARKLLAATADDKMPVLGQAKPKDGPLPDFQFRLPDGTVKTIADYAGKGVVLNLWATWCAPCVAEMPSLDALAAAVRSANAVVLPLSSDRGGAAAVERWYSAHDIKNLPILLDPTGAAARALGARGIPTTLLIDGKGRERGRLEGGADWADPKSIAMVKALADA
jgi:thiol-disulfide isomerase/thioredoxin